MRVSVHLPNSGVDKHLTDGKLATVVYVTVNIGGMDMLLAKSRPETSSRGRTLEEDQASQRLIWLMRGEDRELLSIWANGLVSYRSMARVMGCHNGTVSRRIRQLRGRLANPIARSIVMHERQAAREHRELAIRVFCRGETARAAARELGIRPKAAQRMLFRGGRIRNHSQGS